MIKLLACIVIAWLYVWNIFKYLDLFDELTTEKFIGATVLSIINRTVSFCIIFWALNMLWSK